MKNTTFKKKALISSIAMLLVALVALGSATFAWFTSNPDAAAAGLTVKTSTETGLVAISETEKAYYQAQLQEEVWSHNAILNCDTASHATSTTPVDLQPASYSGSGTTFYTVTADNDNSYVGKSGVTASTAASTAVYKEKVYLKVTGATATTAYLKNVDFDSVANALEPNAVRVLVTDSTGAVLGQWALDGVGNKNITAASAYPECLSSETYACNTAGTALSPSVSVGTVLTNGTSYVNVYVYLDGEDTENYSQNVDATSLINNIELSFSITQ